ncbi:hypothetical protein [Endozoicomonas sp. Mp262]|uniref:hypothetical protein n=1 Tax=Endozoicomonas sp. Mp262 TaxID=2919499 RepID=UPI0021DAB2E7
MYQQNDNNTIVRLSDNAFIPVADGNRDYEAYKQWLAEGNTPQQPPAPDFADAKSAKLETLKAACDAELENIYSLYPAHEADTWFKQEQEARAFLANSSVVTPFLDALAASRGIDKDTVARAIVHKAEAFSVYAAQVIGRKQAIEDQIKQCETLAQLENVSIELGALG